MVKTGDRDATIAFFKNVLAMHVWRFGSKNLVRIYTICTHFRHEEFNGSREAQRHGSYYGRYSKTTVGYEPDSEAFALEITYAYAVGEYELGNDFK